MTSGLTRRGLALGAFALAGVGGLGDARAEIDLDAFMALSEALTGRSDLDPDVGQVYLAALQRHAPKRAALLALSEDRSSPSDEAIALRKEILRNWYTGLVGEGEAREAVTLDGALMWSAMGFSQPKGFCRGPLGYWTEPPAS